MKNLIKQIFLFPVISSLVFAIIFLLSVIYIQKIAHIQIEKELKESILSTKKELSKEIIISVKEEIDFALKNIFSNIKLNIKEKVYNAASLINHILTTYTHLSLSQKKELIFEILQNIEFFKGNGYFFIYDYTTNKILLHPIKEFVNKDILTLPYGKEILQVEKEAINSSPKKEGFALIKFPKPKDKNKYFTKIVFVKYIPKLNWVIGTGEYIDDVKKSLQKEFFNKILNKKIGKNGFCWIYDIQKRKIYSKYPLPNHIINKLKIKEESFININNQLFFVTNNSSI